MTFSILPYRIPIADKGPTYRCGEFGEGSDAIVGDRTEIILPVNIYGCTIGNDCRIGPFVEIQRGVVIGNRVKMGSHSFLCAGVIVEDDVFIGHGVMTCNDRFPRATVGGRLKGPGDWKCEIIRIRKGASIGSGSILLPGIIIGEHAMVGAGSVVTKCVPNGYTVVGNPARVIKRGE